MPIVFQFFLYIYIYLYIYIHVYIYSSKYCVCFQMPLVIPIIFVVFMVFVVCIPLANKPWDTAIGLLLIFCTGVPYYVCREGLENQTIFEGICIFESMNYDL